MALQRGLSNWGELDVSDPRLIAGLGALKAGMRALGSARTGWKIGANDPATQRRLGLGGPVLGPLAAPADASRGVSLARTHLPGVEPEVAITLARDVSHDMQTTEITGCIGAVTTAAELIDLDQRFDDLALLIGRNFLHRSYFTAGTHAAPETLTDAALTAELNGELIWQAPVAFILGDPADLLRCAARNAELLGEKLRRGDVVLSGVVTPLPLWVRPGDTVRLDGGAIGSIELHFTGQPA